MIWLLSGALALFALVLWLMRRQKLRAMAELREQDNEQLKQLAFNRDHYDRQDMRSALTSMVADYNRGLKR